MRYVWFAGGIFTILAHWYMFPDYPGEGYILPIVILYAAMIVSEGGKE